MDQTDVIDFVVHDPEADEVALVMVEGRAWGEKGEHLPDLQAKCSTYLTYALDGQLNEDYPDLAGKRIRFELRSVEPPGEREEKFLTIVRERYFELEGIRLICKTIGA